MSNVTRFASAIFAVLLGLPLLFSALIQTITGFGYDSRPVDEISANYLAGTETFLDEAVAENWAVGFGRNVLTPDDVDSYKYFLGGYLKFPAQEATEVLDDICVRAVVLDDHSGRGAVAFAWIDGVGLMNADVKAIREKLSDITGDGKLVSIDIGSTHTHSGIDTQGLWGNIPKSGRDQKYLDVVIEKTADAIRTAYNTRVDGELYYSSVSCPEMFTDSRNPQVYDDKVHLFRFVPALEGSKEIYIVNFGAHPVNLGWGNTKLSGDFVYYLEEAVVQQTGADFLFVQGAIGGGVGLNSGDEPEELEGFYTQLLAYCNTMADVIFELVENGEKVDPILNVVHEQVDFEVNNFVFKLAERAKLCNAHAFKENGKILLTSEIGYVEIGKNIKILEMPGEVLPEIVYGGFYSAEQAFNGTEYPYAALNTHFDAEDEVLVFGLCNDALGYFVPDNDYSASNDEGHYEETVSTGGKAASTLSQAFEILLAEWR